jgi:hypothetical protein
MDERELFVLANDTLADALGRVVAQRPDAWDEPLPASLATREGPPPTLRELVATHAFDDAWVPAMLAGRSTAEVGEDAFDGDLLGREDPLAAFREIGRAADEAAVACADLDAVVHTSFGDFPAREYLWQVIFFRGVRARDVPLALGVDATLPPALVEGMWEGLSARAEEWRGYGVFPPPVPVPDDAPLQDRLMGLVGRDPVG